MTPWTAACQASHGERFFTITNTGNKPLVLTNVKASCGCTTPEWSKDPILPGKTAQIKVGYNTGIKGSFNKVIEVFSNDAANSRSVLYIKGNVEDTAGVNQEAKLTVAPAEAKMLKAKSAARKQVAAQKAELAK